MAAGTWGSPNQEANYIYNSSGAISVNVNDGYWDQAIAGQNASTGQQKSAPLKLPNVVFFGPFKKILNVFDNFGSDTNLREPNPKPEGGNFFDQPGVTIDGKKVKNMKQFAGKNATLVVNVASK